MSAVEALRDGDLGRALADLQSEVRSSPNEPRHRIFLFQLYSVLGQWDRALTQLHVVRDLDPGAIAMVRTYETALQCELLRQQVFRGERTPLILGDPQPWMAQMLESLKHSAGGNWPASQQLHDEAYETAPASSGTLSHAVEPADPASTSDVEFGWIADGDSRLGPIMEVILNGSYYWVPFARIARIDIEAPTDLRDFVWLPARFLWTNQGEAFGMIPTRYPGSESSQDSQLQLGRRTEWREPAEGVFEGMGQRLLVTDAEEFAIMNVRRIQLSASET